MGVSTLWNETSKLNEKKTQFLEQVKIYSETSESSDSVA